MAETIYKQDDCYFKINRKILKNGTKIHNENGDDIASLHNSKYENTLELKFEDKDDINIKNVIILARKYALEKNMNLFIDYHFCNKYDIQNFVSYNGKLHVPMTNEEVLDFNQKLNKPVDVKMPYDIGNFSKRQRKNIYICSDGHINLDLNSDRTSNLSYLLFNKRICDFSNIKRVFDNSNKDSDFLYNQKAIFQNHNSKNDKYTLPESFDDNVTVVIPVKNNASGYNTIPLIPDFKTDAKHIELENSLSMESAYKYVQDYKKNAKFVNTSFKFSDFMKNALDQLIKTYDNYPHVFSVIEREKNMMPEIKAFQRELESLENNLSIEQNI